MTVEPIAVLSDRYAYLVACTRTREAVVIDPGDVDPIVQRVDASGVKLVAIWNTHHHRDHCGANEALVARYGLRVYGHKSERGRIPGLTDALEDDSELRVGELHARALHTPGHTTGSMTYVVDDAAFTGDTLLGCGCGRNLECNLDVLMSSLQDKLARLAGVTRIYCGREWTERNIRFALQVDPNNALLHERMKKVERQRREGTPSVPSTLAEERATNPFLRCRDEALRARVLGLHGSTEPFHLFARLSAMRERAS